MIEENRWTLEEIRAAYGEILSAYNALFPLDPMMRRDPEDMMDRFAENTTEKSPRGDGDLRRMLRAKAKKPLSMPKEGADVSDNAVVWHRGQPLEGLNQSLRDRVERALKLGI